MLTHLLAASLQTTYSSFFLLFVRALGPLPFSLQVHEHIAPLFPAMHEPWVLLCFS